MGYGERTVWSGLIAGVAGFAVYLVLVVPQLSSGPVDRIAWAMPMLWCVGGAIVGSILLNIAWGILAGIGDGEIEHRSDLRDRDIERMGSRVGQAFGAIGGVGAIALAMVEAPWFWIGNVVFAGFFCAAVVGGVAQLIAYRKGLV